MRQVVWIVQHGERQARQLAKALEDSGLVPILVGAGEGSHLELGEGMDLALALESCPWQLRPALAVRTCPPPPGWEGLPCPLALGPGALKVLEEETELFNDPSLAAQLCSQGRDFRWLGRVHVNMPVVDMLGKYRQLVSEVGIGLELGVDARALDRLNPRDAVDLTEILGNRPRSVHLPFMDLCPASTDPLVAEVSLRRLKAAAALARELRAVHAVAHLGYLPALHRDKEGFVSRFTRTLSPVVRGLAEAGVELVLENTFEPDPELWCEARQALTEASGVEVGLCLDLGHAKCFSAVELKAWWAAGGDYIRELHIHDNDGSFDQHLPPGRGVIDWGWVGRKLKELPGPTVLTLEPHTEAHLWASLRALERLWPEEEE